MTAQRAVIALGILLLTTVSFLFFPGHTILQSDTQIYIPMLEHIVDPSVLRYDIMAVRPHLSFTIYDEVALGLRQLTRAPFEDILLAEQFLYRAAGVLGLFLLASGLGFTPTLSFVAAGLMSLGAAVMGPAVLLVEYEPVPRAFALPFIWLSLGCLSHRKTWMAALSAGVSFAFHPPTAAAYCGLLMIVLLWRRHPWDAALLTAGPALLGFSLLGQAPSPEQPHLFSQIDPVLEQIQRMRASYNWVSIWLQQWLLHYAVVTAIWLAATFRIRHLLSPVLRVFFFGLPAVGIVSVPVSAVLLEHAKWTIIPQFQPGRYLLFLTFFAGLSCAIAGLHAAKHGKYLEAFALTLVPVLLPMDPNIVNLLMPQDASAWRKLIVAASLSGTLLLALRWPVAPVLATLLFYAIPTLAPVRNFPPLHTREMDELVSWAKSSTPQDAVFQFADFGRRLEPGVFRSRALRALYADWKAGGQVNFGREFALAWSERWKKLEDAKDLNVYARLGISFVVYDAAKAPGSTAMFKNSRYSVYSAPSN